MQTALMNVRFEGNNGHDADGTRCLLMTQIRRDGARRCSASSRLSLLGAIFLLSSAASDEIDVFDKVTGSSRSVTKLEGNGSTIDGSNAQPPTAKRLAGGSARSSNAYGSSRRPHVGYWH